MNDFVVWGPGELGRWFGGAALRLGMRVTPITRGMNVREALGGLHHETPILAAVGEDALDEVLAGLPEVRKGSVILLQNELFAAAWQRHHVRPTVMVPWLLKKRGQPELVGRATRVHGVHAELVTALHRVLGVPCITLEDASAVHQALVEKYAFIVTINALGLVQDATLAELLEIAPGRVKVLASEATQLGAALAAGHIDESESVSATHEAMRALGTVSARGRTAAARIKRALGHARALGLSLPELEAIGREAAP
jgi:ketopantoate reductase